MVMKQMQSRKDVEVTVIDIFAEWIVDALLNSNCTYEECLKACKQYYDYPEWKLTKEEEAQLFHTVLYNL